MKQLPIRFIVCLFGLIIFSFLTASVQKEKIGTLRVMGVWGGDELKAFRSVAAEWEKRTGGRMEFEGTRDLAAVLRARVFGGNPPDLAILPNPALMAEFARAGKLKPIDKVLEIKRLRKDYAKTWFELGSVNGILFGLFVKATIKGTIWYNPKEFAARKWEVPSTWKGLISLSDRIIAEEKTPWIIAIESGRASGWPASDWIQEILLHDSGPDLYDQWVDHRIPWSHKGVKSAFEKFGEIALTPGYVTGGTQAILATNFIDGSYFPFEKPPKSYLYLLGGFAQSFIARQFPHLEPGEDYNFFSFPIINPKYAKAITGGADVMVMFRDTAASRSFLKYASLAGAWEPWAKHGGYTSPNRSMSLAVYPDPLATRLAQLLMASPIFRFDADDLMPAQVQNAFWKGAIDYLHDPGRLEDILQEIEETAKEAY